MKKRFSKFMAVLLCGAFLTSAVTGCGNPGDSGTPSSNGLESQSKEDAQEYGGGGEEPTDEIKKIVMAFPTAGVEPADLGLVLDHVNEIARKKIGVEVELRPVSLFEATSTIPRWIGASEQIDLMFIAFSGLSPYTSQNMIQPMDDYLAEYGGYINQMVADGDPILYKDVVDGNTYGVAVANYMTGADGGYIIAKDHLEAANLSYENGQQVDLDELTEIFAAIKKAMPDVYPCGVLGNVPRSGFAVINDPLAATNASGVLIGLESTTVVNYYESEEYQNYIRHMRDWYNAGYIMKDAATTDYNLSELVNSNTISGYFNSVDEALRETQEINAGKEFVNLKLLDAYLPAITPAGNTYWSIPVTAKEPEAAVKFLNLMYEDKEVANTFVSGIEGVHWQFTDKEKGVITYADGLTADTTPYAFGFGLFGDNREAYLFTETNTEFIEQKVATAASRKTKGFGFQYDATAMTNQIIAVQAVINEYVGALETGSADLDKVYPEFIEKLKANGIDEIIADKQAQFNAWLEKQ